MKNMNRREGKKIAVMAAVIMGLMVFAFMPMASATVTSFTVTPSTGIAGAVDSYNALVTTDGVTSINITIPAGFIGMVPMSGGVELVRIDFWNSSTKAYYGYATFTANDTNPATKIDAYCDIGGATATTTQDVDYTPGAINTFETGFGGDTSSVRTKLPTETVPGSIKITINCTAFYLDDVMFAIKQFVRNPSAGDYDFFADGVKETVTITATPGGRSAVYRGRTWYVDTNGDGSVDICFDYGLPNDKPLFGDLNRDGSNDVIVYRGRTWYVDTDGDRLFDLWFNFGVDGAIPLVGDFNHDGRDDIAVYIGRTFYINTTLGASGEKGVDLWYNFGLVDVTKPLVGDFDRDGYDDIAAYIGRTFYISTTLGASGEKGVDLWYNFGLNGYIPLVGDIDMAGGTDIAVWNNGAWYVSTDLGTSGEKAVDLVFGYGLDGDTPLVGDYYG
jgi:hypothetical protein